MAHDRGGLAGEWVAKESSTPTSIEQLDVKKGDADQLVNTIVGARFPMANVHIEIDAIAVNCGYSNSSNLSFAFRKETGMSPRAYRKQFRK